MRLFNMLYLFAGALLVPAAVFAQHAGTDSVKTDTLESITVQPKVPTLRQSGDTLGYRVGGMVMPPDASAESLLRRLPGLEINPDGSVRAFGTKITRVLVDGKDFFGGDPQTAIKQLPAGIIERIEVIDDYGDRGRLTGIKASESPKIINIILKKGMRAGSTAEGAAGAGNAGKYLTRAAGNRFRKEEQLSFTGEASDNSLSGKAPHQDSRLHYADRWREHFTVFGTGAVNHDRQEMQQQTVEDDFTGNVRSHQQSASKTTNNVTGVSANGNLLFEPSRFFTLRVAPSFGLQDQRQDATASFNGTTSDSGTLKKAAGKSSNNTNTRTVAAGILAFAGGQKGTDRWSLQAGIRHTGQQQVNGSFTQDTVTAGDVPVATGLRNRVDNNSSSWNIDADAHYFKGLGGGIFAEAGYQVAFISSLNDKSTFLGDSSGLLPVNSLGSHFQSQTLLHRFRAGLAGHKEHWDFTVAADFQPGSITGSEARKALFPAYRFFRTMPVAEGSYTLSKKSRLSAYYQSSPVLPSAQQLQPVTDLSNPQYPVKGNPFLKTGYTQSATVHYEYRSVTAREFTGFGVSAGYHGSSGMVIPNLLHPKDNSVVLQETTYQNADGFHGWEASYHFNLPSFWHRRIRISGSGSITHDFTTTLTDSVAGHTITTAWNQSLHATLIIPGLLEADASCYYNRTANTLQGAGKQLPALNAGYQLMAKAYFCGRGAVSIVASEAYTGTGKLTASPAMLNATLQWNLFRAQTGSIALTGYNLLGGSNNANQSATPTSVIRTTTSYTDRFFMVSFLYRLQHYYRRKG